MADDFARAKDLLLGAVNTVLSLANQEKSTATQEPGTSASAQLSRRPSHGSSSCSSTRRATQDRSSQFSRELGSSSSASIEEHRRLFGYKPKKGKLPRPPAKRGRRKGSSTWKKDLICLRDTEQGWKPSSEEKIELAKMGLGLSEALFNVDGDAEHIHSDT